MHVCPTDIRVQSNYVRLAIPVMGASSAIEPSSPQRILLLHAQEVSFFLLFGWLPLRLGGRSAIGV